MKQINPWVLPGLDLSKTAKIKAFVNTICKHYRVKEEHLNLKTRKQDVVNARKAISYYLINQFGYTEEKAANYFNQTISRSNVHHYKITYGNLLHVKDFDSITLDDKVQRHFKKYDILSSQ